MNRNVATMTDKKQIRTHLATMLRNDEVDDDDATAAIEYALRFGLDLRKCQDRAYDFLAGMDYARSR